MRKINIIHWDDDAKIKAFSELTIPKILSEFNIEVEPVIFILDPDKIIDTLSNIECDLIILDLKDKDNNDKKGFEILTDIIRDYSNKIPILIYTRYDNFTNDVINFKTQYNLKIQLLDKKLKTKSGYDRTLRRILIELLNLKPILADFTPENDITTKHVISKIGLINLKGIIGVCSEKIENLKKSKIKRVEAITSGYSGAYVLVVEFETHSKLFKISNNYEQIKREFQNLEKYATQIKSALRVDYERTNPDNIYYNGWYTIIYEYLPHNKSLFDWLSDIGNKNKTNEIEKIFKNIFSKYGILQLNKVEKTLEKPVNENILQDIDESRVSYINISYKELSIILKQFESDYKCNKEDILDSILETHSYSYISKSKIKTPTSKLYLSHNDLHANNILLDDQNMPRIIDPGNVQEKHWSSDICRLLVDLIIRGLDKKDIDFFKLETITKWFNPIINLIRDKSNLEINDKDKNIGFIIAINWLRNNVEKIYSDIYEEWEFQLGIVVELLKASYKTDSLPPGKRALAIMLACEVLNVANKNLEKKITGDK